MSKYDHDREVNPPTCVSVLSSKSLANTLANYIAKMHGDNYLLLNQTILLNCKYSNCEVKYTLRLHCKYEMSLMESRIKWSSQTVGKDLFKVQFCVE